MKGFSGLTARRKFSVPVSQQEVERDWAAQGFHCGAMVDPPGHEWNNFTHEANELVAVVEGRMRFTLLDESFNLEPGDEIFIPAGVATQHQEHRGSPLQVALRL
ncbi:hypothetical protein ABPG75_008891 [Micractinium tetrahymenae]